MKQLGIASFTARGGQVADRLAGAFGKEYEIIRYDRGLKDWCGCLFASGADGIVFVGACGIAVRTIAPFLKSKTTDPAVIVIDEAGQFVISLLSGHIGGANRLAERTAAILGATPVITTATDVNGKFAVDIFASDNHLRIRDMHAAKEISAAILRGERVGVTCEGEIEGCVPPELILLKKGEKKAAKRAFQMDALRDAPRPSHSIPEIGALIRIGAGIPLCDISFDVNEKTGAAGWNQAETELTWCVPDLPSVILDLYPKSYIIGIGCRKGKTETEIAQYVEQALTGLGLSFEDCVGVASIDLKKEETGLLEFCGKRNLRFETYSAETLAEVKGEFSHSAFVSQVTGVDNVCERAALCMAGEGGRLILKKQAENGVTVALAERKWKVWF
ncbi:MAG: cobalt-precorrin 5A hydrolase [Lachnospiraceae bacterium]|nr:cobalt-precorrin 5A hydrolase [Lachnospiraceae bacterium]